MFTRVQALRYRCLRSVDQELGRFATLVGPNASGKTTFLDVIAFLGDLMRNGGKIVDTVMSRSSDFEKLLWMGEGNSFQLAVEARIPESVRGVMADDKKEFHSVRYEIEISLDENENEIVQNHEALWLLKSTTKSPIRQGELFPMSPEPADSIFQKPGKERKRSISNQPNGNANYYADGKKTYNPSFRLGRQTAALANIPADLDSFHAAPWFRSLLLDGVQTLTLNSQKIRQPSPPGLGGRFQPDGSNLPWVVAELRKQALPFRHWLDHIQTALPDIQDIESIERPEDRHRYLVIQYSSGARVPSWLASDGTLRLLALTIPAYLPSSEEILLIEEPENGIHPRAIETVLQSLQSLYNGQVLLATHSPVALNMLDPKDVLCFAKDASGATDVISGDRHPALKDWKRGEPDFGVLFAAGILS
jgi:predicted ATPase